MHRQAGLPVPRLDAAGRRALRAAAKPATVNEAVHPPAAASLARIAGKCPRDLAGLRDRALLLLAAAMLRPERRRGNGVADNKDQANDADEISGDVAIPRLFLLALDAEHVRFTADGVLLAVRTRADEATPSRRVILRRSPVTHACPVRALEDWLRSSDTAFGPVFRKVDRWGNVEHARLGPDAWHRILARRGGTSSPRARSTSDR